VVCGPVFGDRLEPCELGVVQVGVVGAVERAEGGGEPGLVAVDGVCEFVADGFGVELSE
jgi:hypothetical protein